MTTCSCYCLGCFHDLLSVRLIPLPFMLHILILCKCHHEAKLYLQQPVEPKEGQKVLEKKAGEQKPVQDTEQKVASNVEVKTTPTAEAPEEKVVEKPSEEASLPKCIGPGCENDAQPDSVYCGNDCILRHAAAAMKSISDDKEPKEDKVNPEKAKSAPKVTRRVLTSSVD